METPLTKENVYDRIIESIQDDAIFLLAAIKKQEGLVKHQLEDETNILYQSLTNQSDKLINSRFTLDIMVAKLEGSSLIKIKEQGRSKRYMLSDVGKELIDYYQTNIVNSSEVE